MLSTHNQIENSIKKRGRGKIFFAEDFIVFGTSVAVRHTLSRLCKEELIVRLSAGIYLYPKIDEQIGVLYPSIEAIAKAIAKREKARLIPTGVYALNALGLSTQVPMKVVYLTDGAPRVIKVGKKATVNFKKTTAKNLAFKGKITALIIFALKEIGNGKATESDLHKIKEALSHETYETIIHDAKLAPEWISNIILKFHKGE
jgi:hypothetical protein